MKMCVTRVEQRRSKVNLGELVSEGQSTCRGTTTLMRPPLEPQYLRRGSNVSTVTTISVMVSSRQPREEVRSKRRVSDEIAPAKGSFASQRTTRSLSKLFNRRRRSLQHRHSESCLRSTSPCHVVCRQGDGSQGDVTYCNDDVISDHDDPLLHRTSSRSSSIKSTTKPRISGSTPGREHRLSINNHHTSSTSLGGQSSDSSAGCPAKHTGSLNRSAGMVHKTPLCTTNSV